MQNFKNLSDSEIVTRLKNSVEEERKITIQILSLLREVERRQLFAEIGYASLFEYATQELKYSAAAAFRRIESMRLLKEFPEVETKIAQGQLSLSVVAQAQQFFKTQQLAPNEKRDILKTLEGKSSREAERELLKISPESIKPERTRQITEELTEIRFHLTQDQMAKIQQIKNCLSHKNPNFSWAELLMELTERALKALPTSEVKTCSYVNPQTGKKCGSRFQVQMDHIQPRALGGGDEPSNLRPLCRAHNILAATQILGRERMVPFVPSLN